MTEDDYKAVISTYQQKSFELFNQNLMLEAQINQLKKTIEELNSNLNSEKNEDENF